MVKDSDGFELSFNRNCTVDDKAYFVSKYPKVDVVVSERVHCTTCDVHIGTSPNAARLFRTHPLLRVTHCNDCFISKFVGVKFFKGLDGSDYYCKWCGDGGKLFCCSKCPAVFCAKCVKINFSAADVEEIEQDDNWLCFLCNKDTLRLHRARHWALQNFMKKQENFMLNKTMTKSQIRNAMAKDLSTCCPSPKRLGATGVRPLSVSPGRKRTAPSGPSKRSKRSQSTSQGCGVRPLSVSPGRKRTAPSGPSKRPQRSQSESQGSSSMSLRSTTPVRTNPSAPPNTPLKSILSNKRLMLNHPTFFRVATDECDAITGVLNICQNTINEIISLDTNLAPETESRLNVLCTSLQYLNNYTADLMKKHKANITNEWEQTRK